MSTTTSGHAVAAAVAPAATASAGGGDPASPPTATTQRPGSPSAPARRRRAAKSTSVSRPVSRVQSRPAAAPPPTRAASSPSSPPVASSASTGTPASTAAAHITAAVVDRPAPPVNDPTTTRRGPGHPPASTRVGPPVAVPGPAPQQVRHREPVHARPGRRGRLHRQLHHHRPLAGPGADRHRVRAPLPHPFPRRTGGVIIAGRLHGRRCGCCRRGGVRSVGLRVGHGRVLAVGAGTAVRPTGVDRDRIGSVDVPESAASSVPVPTPGRDESTVGSAGSVCRGVDRAASAPLEPEQPPPARPAVRPPTADGRWRDRCRRRAGSTPADPVDRSPASAYSWPHRSPPPGDQ